MRSTALVAIAFSLVSSLSAFKPVNSAPSASPDVVIDVLPAYPRRPSAAPAPNSPTAPSFPSFNSEQLDRQLQRYLTYVEQNGVPNVLIVGSSRALQGIDPLTLRQVLQQQGATGLTVYNFGINGATAQVVDWMVHQLLPVDHRPQLVIWADGSRAFNSGRIDHTFSNIIASKGHRHLLAGSRPPTRSPDSLKLAQVCMDLLPLPLSAPAQPTAPSRQHQATTAERSPLNQCQRPVKLLIRQASATLTAAPTPHLAEALGFQVVKTQFNPSQYFQRFPRVAGQFDRDYRNFNLGGRQLAATERVAQWASKRNIPLVIVNLPVTNTYLDDSRRLYEDRFRNQMQRLARSQRFTFVDLATVPTLAQNRYFADPSHLNQLGAIAVATELGKQLNRLGFTQQLQATVPVSIPSKLLPPLLPISQLTLHMMPGQRYSDSQF